MLRTLRIRNLAVIEELAVQFGDGFHVLTGETGAGKSILLDALGLTTGARAQGAVVRDGADRAWVEAIFEPPPGSRAVAVLDERGLALEDGAILVRREIAAAGGGRAFVNDSPCTVGMLRALFDGWVDILAQNRHHTLRAREAQRSTLDSFGAHREVCDAVRDSFERVRALRARVDDLATQRRSREERSDLLGARIDEIDAVAPVPGEREQLVLDRRLLAHAGRVRDTIEGALTGLYDDDGAAAERIARAARALDGLADVDPAFGERATRLESARAEIEDVVDSLRGLLHDDTFDPARAERTESRLAAIERLFLRFGETEEEILRYREQAAEELATLVDLEGEIDRARRDLLAAEREYATAAARLSERRRTAAAALQPAVERGLAELAMKKARMRVEFVPEAGSPALDDAGREVPLHPHGAERVEFLLAANPGEPPRPLGQVASGGELSRVMLALHGALDVVGEGGILVFDEVDAGVGGATADAVGRRLAALSRGRQVLCVTHLPQVAAHADRHYIVSKRVADGRSRTAIRELADEERVDELARMLGGRKVTDASRHNAADLIRAAGSARQRQGRTA